MELDQKIYIAGHKGMVGSSIQRTLMAQGYHNIVTATSSELDLRNPRAVADFFDTHRPDYVFLAAAKVGGIWANDQFKAEFLYDNLCIQNNVIHQSYRYEVKKLLFLGSSCIYPKHAAQPIEESALLTGSLEPTNEPYAVAKIAGIKMCQAYRFQYGCDFISCMPSNLYGPNDNYHPTESHVIPALLNKFHLAKIQGEKKVEIWGSGQPRREFLYVDDLARACVVLMKKYQDQGPINVGYGSDISIKELAYLIKGIVEYKGKIRFNRDYPDGTPRKLLSTTKINRLGWCPQIELEEGLSLAYDDMLQQSVSGILQ